MDSKEKRPGPVCPCQDCYVEWAQEEIDRLLAEVSNSRELSKACWEVNRTLRQRLKETTNLLLVTPIEDPAKLKHENDRLSRQLAEINKQRLMAEGKVEQYRLVFEQMRKIGGLD